MPAPAPASSEASLVLAHVNVVDVERGTVAPDRTVVVRGSRVVEEGPASGVRVPREARIVEARGAYVMPGLWDMHAHLRGRPRPAEVDLPLYLANGVTGVRDMASDCHGDVDRAAGCVDDLRRLAARIEAGEALGPRPLALASWGVDGPLPPEAGPAFFSARTEAEGRQLARHFAARRVDFIKVLSRVPREGYFGLVDEARRLGLPVAGHEPLAVSAVEVAKAGQRSVEHARVFLTNCFAGAATYRAEARSATPRPAWMRRMVDEYDPARCADVFAAFREHGTWYVPTHVTRRVDAYAADPAFRADERLKYVTAAEALEWRGDLDRTVAKDPSAAGNAARLAFYEKGLAVTGAAHAQGVRVLLGTDAGDTHIFPGFSAHDELEQLVKAGLSPAQALRAATADAAEFLGKQAAFGTIRAGKVADLVLLDGDPLASIANTRRIRAVAFGGRWFDRGALDGLLRDAEAAARRPDSPEVPPANAPSASTAATRPPVVRGTVP